MPAEVEAHADRSYRIATEIFVKMKSLGKVLQRQLLEFHAKHFSNLRIA